MADEGVQRGGGGSSPVGLGLMILFLMILFGGVFYLLHRDLVLSAMLWLRHIELRAIGLFTDRYVALDAAVVSADLPVVTMASVWSLSEIVGSIYHLFAALFLAILAVFVLVFSPAHRFRARINGLDDLVRAMGDRFRFTRFWLSRDRVLRMPVWGARPRPDDIALRPTEWLAAYGRGPGGRFSEVLVRQALIDQLGPLWVNVRLAPPHVRCLFAVFALHADRQRDDAISFLGDIAEAMPPGNGDTFLTIPDHIIAVADQILEDVEIVRPCSRIAAKHAYLVTALMGVLSYARERSGVLSPSEAPWLKLVDRGLCYALSMPPNPFVEALGAEAHYRAEVAAGDKIFTPQIEPAVRAVCSETLQTALAEQRRV